MDPEILVKRFVLRLKLRKQIGDAVQNCAAFLRHELNKDGQIIQGFAVVAETNEKLQYYWVEDISGTVYDVCFEIARLNNPVVENIKYKLVKECWGTDFDKDDHNQELFKLYRDEPSKFWKSVPRLNS
jgi:hypothetical protein